ncbi:tetratricopeptide repeat domain-containing [Pyrenophora seminiperda CCB06]|uniref:ER membrane protein complex subunit 2 n=1 Tax=Pyrenophora seminiperda CCB06 TaxID=1302712 RepID=A0A3M7MI50_9PLEO|nr:tetratricopeptide repeat domain-containing [Pyrenophora seminiperda CCB06]
MTEPNLLSPPAKIPPPVALALSQKAPRILSTSLSSWLPWPLSLLFSRETPETWTIHENLFLSTLRTGDESAALAILARLETRFGNHNERIMALRGIYNEATSKSDAELENVFDAYQKILKDDPTNMSIKKRSVAVLKALGRTSDAIDALNELLQNSPTDAEAWAEASELYASTEAWGQAIYCAEEVMLITPNAWSAHAHVATLHYLSTKRMPNHESLVVSLKHFCRSVELNDGYLRGYYGLKFISAKLTGVHTGSAQLEEIATRKLAEIVRQYKSGNKSWQGYDEAEIIAAGELLDRDVGV